MRTNSESTMPCSLAITPFSMRSSKKRHVVCALGEDCSEDVLQQRFGKRRVVGEIGECDLGLDHPELREVPAGVGILRPERRAERVDLGQRHAVGLDVQLTRNGEERLARRRSPARNPPAVGIARQVQEVERGDAKELASALGVGRRDDRRVRPTRSR